MTEAEAATRDDLAQALGEARLKIKRLEEENGEKQAALEVVARWAATKPTLSDKEARRIIAYHPTIRGIVARWLTVEQEIATKTGGALPDWARAVLSKQEGGT